MNLLQEETLMKDLEFGNDNSKVIFIAKRTLLFLKEKCTS